MPEVLQAFWKRGYILVLIGEGVTVIVRGDDICLHHAPKKEYRKKETQLMLQKLSDHPQKVQPLTEMT